MIDATIVRAHQHSADAQKNDEQAIRRSRGRLSTKIYALVDALGNPVELMLSPGQANDLICAEPLLENSNPAALIGDKAYDAHAFRESLASTQITPVIPSHPAVRFYCRAISSSTASATSSSASSINSSTFVPSQHATISSPEILLLASIWLRLSSCSTEDRL
jgi:Transposase DDE domain